MKNTDLIMPSGWFAQVQISEEGLLYRSFLGSKKYPYETITKVNLAIERRIYTKEHTKYSLQPKAPKFMGHSIGQTEPKYMGLISIRKRWFRIVVSEPKNGKQQYMDAMATIITNCDTSTKISTGAFTTKSSLETWSEWLGINLNAYSV